MRILVADQNALLLAAITATFGKHCDLVTANRREVCIAYLEQEKFDVVVACDKLADYTGLELLSEVGTISPGTLLIFAASPERLQRLSYRLQVFGLLDTLAYPITPRKLLNALRRAREHLPARATRKIRHVVLESEWDTGERLALVEKDLDAAVARHSSGIGEGDWANSPAASAEHARRAGGADAGSLGDRGVEEFVFAASPSYEDEDEDEDEAESLEKLPATQESHWEVNELQGFVYESAGNAVIEVMPAEVPVAHAEDPLEQVDYEAVGNDPTFDVPESPDWAEDGAANDIAFGAAASTLPADQDGGQTLSATLTSGGSWSVNPPPALEGSQPPAPVGDDSAASQSAAPEPASSSESAAAASVGSEAAAKRLPQPRMRAQTVPTDGQRAAFERAMARRNAERTGGTAAPVSDAAAGTARKKGGADTHQKAGSAAAVGSMFTGARSGQSKSLSDLARIATSKRPLSVTGPGKTVPKRAMFAVGSGVAAVILLGVLSSELFRPDHSAVAQQRAAQATNSQLFGRTIVSSTGQQNSGTAQPQQGQQAPQYTAPGPPMPQDFDPNAAPPDPPPPPPLEQPGPMEPPPPWAQSQQPPYAGPPPGVTPGDNDPPPIFQ